MAPSLLIATVAIAMAWWTWATWTDVIVDVGREVYLAWQVHDGRRLYVDVASFNGPLSPYVNAFWFRLFGVGLRSLVLGNLIVLTAFVPLLFRLLSRVGNRLSATIATLVFVALFAFGEYDDVGNFNYITPYSHELVHGLVLSLAGMGFLFSYLRSGRRRSVAAVGVCLGLVFLTKPEVCAAATIALLGGATCAVWRVEAGWRIRVRTLSTMAGCVFIPPLAMVGLLSRSMSVGAAAFALLAPYRYVTESNVAALPFYARLTGLAEPAAAAGAIASSAAVYGIGIAAALAVSFGGRRLPLRDELTALVALLLCGWGLTYYGAIVSGVARPWPLFMLILVSWLAVRLRREWHDEARARILIGQIAFVGFAGLLLLKVALNTRMYRYGFVLTMPAAMVMLIWLTAWIPAWLERRGRDGSCFRIVAGVCVGLVALVFLAAHRERLDKTTYTIGRGANWFRGDSRLIPANAMAMEIAARLGPADRLAVFPEGAMLNVLTHHPSSVPYVNFLPPELEMFGESRMVQSLTEQPPEYVVLVDRPMAEYALEGIGVDYGQALAAWIARRYVQVVSVPGAPIEGRRFGMRLLRRADLPTIPRAGIRR